MESSTKDAGCFLTHIVHAGWHVKLKTSVVAFNLTQFFPSINCDVLLSVLEKQGFAPEEVVFLWSYLVNWSTHCTWDNNLSPEFPSSMGVGPVLYNPPPVHMESAQTARTARTMLVIKKKAQSPCGLCADLLKFTRKKLLH
jgi:hypothetical protein